MFLGIREPSMAIETLSNVKTALGVSGTDDDAILTPLLTSAESFVEDFCGRSFQGGTFVEFYPGGMDRIFLRQFPILAVASLRVDATGEFDPETERPANSYAIHSDRGVIENREGTFVPTLPGWDLTADHFPRAVRVEYTAATNSIPRAVHRAYVELIGHWYRQTKTAIAADQLHVIQQTAADGATTIYPWSQSTGAALPANVLQLLKPFRVPSL
jgi:hypothetical protein